MKYSAVDYNNPIVGIFGEGLTGFKRDDINIEFIYPYYDAQFDMRPKVLTGDGGAGSGTRISGSAEADASSFGLYLLPGETAIITAQNVADPVNVVTRVVFNWVEYH